MNGKTVLGMVFANVHEEALDSLTAMRTMGSVPFCSRYRLIDFPLSNMVESGITTRHPINLLRRAIGSEPATSPRPPEAIHGFASDDINNTFIFLLR